MSELSTNANLIINTANLEGWSEDDVARKLAVGALELEATIAAQAERIKALEAALAGALEIIDIQETYGFSGELAEYPDMVSAKISFMRNTQKGQLPQKKVNDWQLIDPTDEEEREYVEDMQAACNDLMDAQKGGGNG